MLDPRDLDSALLASEAADLETAKLLVSDPSRCVVDIHDGHRQAAIAHRRAAAHYGAGSLEYVDHAAHASSHDASADAAYRLIIRVPPPIYGRVAQAVKLPRGSTLCETRSDADDLESRVHRLRDIGCLDVKVVDGILVYRCPGSIDPEMIMDFEIILSRREVLRDLMSFVNRHPKKHSIIQENKYSDVWIHNCLVDIREDDSKSLKSDLRSALVTIDNGINLFRKM